MAEGEPLLDMCAMTKLLPLRASADILEYVEGFGPSATGALLFGGEGERNTTDPMSGRPVDKAVPFVGNNEIGAHSYFESRENRPRLKSGIGDHLALTLRVAGANAS